MKQLFLMVNDGSVRIIETPAPTVRDNCVIVETMYSVVSAGTERGLTAFGGKGLIRKAMERPDQLKKVMEKISTDGILTTVGSAFTRLNEPMPMGYSGVGRVTAVGRGVTEYKAGDTVAMAGQAYHAEVNRIPKTMLAKIPEGVSDYRQYAMSALGGIALQGIHQADVRSGETVAVIGLGLVGHICARLLNAYGCDVIGYDIDDKSLPATRLKAFINSNDENAVDITKSLTMGRGADKVIITAACNSNAPMELAAAITRDRGIICMIGVTQMNIDRRPFYERELTFTMARSYGPGRYDTSYEDRAVDYPIGYVRFTEGRNIEEYVRIAAQKRADFTDLITHVIPFDEAESAYEMITKNANDERYIGILLQYSQDESKWQSVIHRHGSVTDGKITAGLIGAGKFARSTLLPVMKASGKFAFKMLATTGGTSAAQASESFGFETVTNDYTNILKDPDTDLVIISTNHDSHAKFIVEALEAGKSVYCEKPLCLTTDELDRIERAYAQSDGELFCGMNRRFAPQVREIKKKLSTDRIPAVYDYIVNAGAIPDSHWTQDERVGGGRIIGEACHFVDTVQYLDGTRLTDMRITFADNSAYKSKDNALITLSFESGAVASIVYTSMGSKKYPKEQLRVFSNGTVYELDNYIRLSRYGAVKATRRRMRQDKGFAAEYEHIAAVLSGKADNTAINDAFTSHRLIINALAGEKNNEI